MMMVMTMGGDTHGGDDDLYIAGVYCYVSHGLE